MSTQRRHIRYDPYNDYYILLGVVPTASPDEMQQAFRQRAKVVHPDRNPDRIDWAKEQFQQLNTAYDILSSLEARMAYDRQRAAYFAKTGIPTDDYWWLRAEPKREEPPPRETPPFESTTWTSRKPPPSVLYRKPVKAGAIGLLIGPYRYVLVIIFMVLLINVGFIWYWAYLTH